MNTTFTTIQEAIRTIGYSVKHTGIINDKMYEFFKLDSDGYIYVLCIDTNRATRYNSEGWNGKRISMEAYLEANETLNMEAAIAETEESIKTEEAKEIADLYCRHPEGTDLQVPAVIDPQYGYVDCSGCNVQNCVHRNCMRRNPTNYGGLAECPRLKVKAEEPKQPKAKKSRKSKNVFHTSIAVPGLTLTDKQVEFMLHLSDTCFWEDGLDSTVWVDCLCDDIQGQFAGKPMTVGAMISTLCEKGLGIRTTERRDGRKCTSFALTETGKLVAAEVGLQ